MTQDTVNTTQRSKGRRMLLLLLLAFALPVALVVGMYIVDWRPGGGSHGQLVQPPLPLRFGDLQDSQGRTFPAARWKGKWHLVQIDGNGCADACQQQAQLLRNVHVALNKEIGRVERVLLLPQPAPMATLHALQQRYPDLVILSGAETAAFANQFHAKEAAGDVYLVDPLGNMMMRYPPDYQAKGLHRDLGRLLRYSWVG